MRRLLAGLFSVALIAGCVSAPTVLPGADEDVLIRSRGVDVPATWVVPARDADAAVPLVVLIHGHGGTRDEAGGFRRLAAMLVDQGIATIRMDFPGCGESTEPWHQNNLTHMIADVAAAQVWAENATSIDPARVGLVGFSMGGRVASLYADRQGGIDAMVLWAPAVEDGAGAIVDMLGGEASYASMRQTAVDAGWVAFTTFWGQQQQLGAQWFEDMERTRPLEAIGRFGGALRLVHGSADVVVPPGVSVRAEQAADAARRVDRVVLAGADHGFGLFAEKDLYSDTLIESTVGFFVDEW